jgi:hypothetical protein
VSQLDANCTAVCAHEIDHGLQRLDLAVIPQTQISSSNAATRVDSSTFRQDETCSPKRELPEVNHMPGRGSPRFSGMLAHRRYDNAIFQLQLSKLQWLKQQRLMDSHDEI